MGQMVRTGFVVAGACALLTGCFGTTSPEPTSSLPRHHPSPTQATLSTTDTSSPTSPPTSPATSTPTSSAPTTSGPASVLRFSPKSDGRHSHTCIAVAGSDPVDYVYYPVMVAASAPVTLDQVSVTYADGVQVAGAWVAPRASTGGTGIVEGWPAPSILTQSSSVQWSKRVTAAGVSLAPGAPSDTVFLHLRVYPDALPVTTDGVALTFHEATGGSAKTTWIDHLTFRATC